MLEVADEFREYAGWPQMGALERAVAWLRGRDDVVAVWVGGSFAAGTADVFSDVDLRVMVRGDRFESWREVDFAGVFGAKPLIDSFQPHGAEALLHHLLLAEGVLFDFFVMREGHVHREEATRLVFSREAGVAGGEKEDARTFAAPTAGEVRKLLEDFWIVQFKHAKVVGRGMAVLAAFGVFHERTTLLRMIHLDRTGTDCTSRLSIHTLSVACREVDVERQAVLGMPVRTMGEVIAAIEANRELGVSLGRRITARFGVEYPEEMERVSREAWRRAVKLVR